MTADNQPVKNATTRKIVRPDEDRITTGIKSSRILFSSNTFKLIASHRPAKTDKPTDKKPAIDDEHQGHLCKAFTL